MSDNESNSNHEDEGPKLTEEEIVKMVSEKIFEAFKVFDPEGNGGQVKTDQLRELLEYCELKMEDQEMYKIVSELDPSQNGYIEVAAFKNYVV